jgi:hypothetical protein
VKMPNSSMRQSPGSFLPRAGGMLAIAVAWAVAWLYLRAAFAVWLILLGVYVAMMVVLPWVYSSTTDSSGSYHSWLPRFVRTAGWLVLSGFLSIALFVLYFIAQELAGNPQIPQ